MTGALLGALVAALAAGSALLLLILLAGRLGFAYWYERQYLVNAKALLPSVDTISARLHVDRTLAAQYEQLPGPPSEMEGPTSIVEDGEGGDSRLGTKRTNPTSFSLTSLREPTLIQSGTIGKFLQPEFNASTLGKLEQDAIGTTTWMSPQAPDEALSSTLGAYDQSSSGPRDLLQSVTGLASYDYQTATKRLAVWQKYRDPAADAAQRDMNDRPTDGINRLQAEEEIIENYRRVFADVELRTKQRCANAKERLTFIYGNLLRLSKDSGYDSLRRRALLAAAFGSGSPGVDEAPTEREVGGYTDLWLAARQAVTRVESLKATTTREARLAFQEKEIARGHLQAFRIRHEISPVGRPAFYSDSPWTDFAIIISFAIVEIVTNGLLFLETSRSGVAGGLFNAVLFAPVNVFFASMIGLVGLRFAIHVDAGKRWSARILTVLLVLLVLLINLYKATVRLSLDLDLGYSISETLGFFFSELVLDAAGYQALGVFVLGLMLALLVAWKAYRFYDKYPGFTQVYRDFRERLDAYERLPTELSESLERVREEVTAALVQIYEDAEESAARFRLLVEACLFEERQAHVAAMNILLDCKKALREFTVAYGEANRVASDMPREIDESLFYLELPEVASAVELFEQMDSGILGRIQYAKDQYIADVNEIIDQECSGVDQLFQVIENEKTRIQLSGAGNSASSDA